eukprot:CAMPEP_0194042414 /NCGR_PEP_ID=MMETSP0009_2-20130614/14188_1 /TAXON_ID=210454 /ORGANISM="Grammatophora oceanica, Strain CCMP 410" /LENGTH=119 /DNA_ID=CAMNT_0038686249 /DNA_START=153 /DNA_END=512 /DNA_ORIENTATION=+
MPPDEGDEAELASDVEYTGSVDWDAEWKKVVENPDSANRPKGKYKSQAETKAIKTLNKGIRAVDDKLADIPPIEVPSWNSIKGDWKFWIGVIAVISVLSSVVGGMGQQQMPDPQSSYYI